MIRSAEASTATAGFLASLCRTSVKRELLRAQGVSVAEQTEQDRAYITFMRQFLGDAWQGAKFRDLLRLDDGIAYVPMESGDTTLEQRIDRSVMAQNALRPQAMEIDVFIPAADRALGSLAAGLVEIDSRMATETLPLFLNHLTYATDYCLT